MTETMKYRLIGVAIIFLLAIIFLPQLLDGSGRPDNKREGVAINKVEIIPLEQVLQKNADTRVDLITLDTIDSGAENLDLAKTAEGKADRLLIDAEASRNQERPPFRDKEDTVATLSVIPLEKPVSSPDIPPSSLTSSPKDHGSWFVQIGSFGKHKNADRLMNSLTKRGFNARVSKGRMADKGIYRVHVGPTISRQTAEQLREKIEQDFKTKGLILQLTN